jgi:hypothetical protein
MTAQLRSAPGVFSREIGDESVLVDLERGQYFGLNETGRAVWRGLEAGDSRETIAAKVATEFAVPFDRALSDVEALLFELRRAGLVQPS